MAPALRQTRRGRSRGRVSINGRGAGAEPSLATPGVDLGFLRLLRPNFREKRSLKVGLSSSLPFGWGKKLLQHPVRGFHLAAIFEGSLKHGAKPRTGQNVPLYRGVRECG